MALSKALKENAERNRRYWEEREAEQLKNNITEEKEFDKQLKQIYSDMLDGVQKEIDAFYGKYARKEGITIAEAKKRVSQADIREYERKAKKYVKDAAKDRRANGGTTDTSGYYFSERANEEMRLYNLTMKVNRLEMLKANIGLELIDGHSKLEAFMSKILRGRTEAELRRQAGILGKTVQDNAKSARVIVNASFHNATFSDRIWQYQDLMKNDLSKTLQTALIQGKNPRAVAGELRRYWYGNDPRTGGGAVYCMERLMRTELARVQTEAQKESFIRNGFTQYTFHVNSGCCDICSALNGKHFKVDKMMPGENAPPLHPHCRCSVSAYEDSEEYEQWLDFLANGGTTAEWNKLKNKQTGGKHYKPVDPDNKKDVAAANAYRKISRENDINVIAKNTGFKPSEIKEIKRHIFFDKHKKYDGYDQLDPDYDIAVAWYRLKSGNYKDRDITLLNHELLENELEKKYNLTISEAHHRANEKYNWEKQLIDEVGEGGEKDDLV